MATKSTPDGSVIIEITLTYEKFVKDSQEAQKTAERVGKAIEEAVNPDTKGLVEVNKQFKSVDSSAQSVKESVNKLKESQQQLNQLYKSGSIGEKEYKALKKEISDTQQTLKDYSTEFNKATREYEKNAEKVAELTKTSESLEVQLEAIVQETRNVYKEFEGISGIDAIDQLVNSSLEANKEFQNLSQESENLNNQIQKYSQGVKESSAAQQKFSEGTQEAAKRTEELSNQISNVNKTASDTKGISTLQIAFGNLVAKGIQLAISALKDFIKTGIEYQTNLEAVNSTLGYVFGDQGQKMINEWANTTAAALGFSEGAAKDYAKQIGLIFEGSKKSGAALAEMSTKVIQAGRDWASFNNLDTDKTLSAIENALRGNISSLGQYGIALNKNDLENTKYRKGIRGTWNELQTAEKAQIVYNAILDKTSVATGHAAANQDSYSNQLFLFKNNLEKISGTLASDFLPTLTTVLSETNAYLNEHGEVLTSIGTIVSSVLNVFLQLIKALSTLPPELLLIIGYVILAVQAFEKVEGGLGAVNKILGIFDIAIDKTTIKIIALVAAVSVLLFLILSIKEGTEKATQGLNGLSNAASKATNAAQKGYATGTNYAGRGWYEVAEQGPELLLTRNGTAMLLTQGGERIFNATATASMISSGGANAQLSHYSGGPYHRNADTFTPSSTNTYNDYREFNIMGLRDLEELTQAAEYAQFRQRKV